MSIKVNNDSKSNINSNSMFLKKVYHDKTREKEDKKYLNKNASINLGSAQLMNNLSKGKLFSKYFRFREHCNFWKISWQ
jgi:hypothetical protein